MSCRGGAESEADDLVTAAMEGDAMRVRELLAQGADPNAEAARPLLREANDHVPYEVARLLLDGGADVNGRDNIGYTPPHWAAEYGRPDVAELLVQHGADLAAVDAEGSTPLELALRRGASEVARVLLAAGGPVTLPAAVMLGDLAKVTAMLDDAESQGTPADLDMLLHDAAETGQTAAAALLLGRGADLESRDGCKETPLHCAAESGHADTAELLLLRGASPKPVASQGYAALHLAVHEGHIEVVRVLLRQGADINQPAEDEYIQYRPLHVAVMRDINEERPEPSEMLALLLDSGADINAMCCSDYTALMLATDMRAVPQMEQLLSRGADIRIPMEDGLQPIHMAAFHGEKAVRLLLEYGADVHARDERGCTPLHHVTSCAHPDLGAAEALIEHGAGVNARDNEGRTPLAYAERGGFDALAALLRCHGGIL